MVSSPTAAAVTTDAVSSSYSSSTDITPRTRTRRRIRQRNSVDEFSGPTPTTESYSFNIRESEVVVVVVGQRLTSLLLPSKTTRIIAKKRRLGVGTSTEPTKTTASSSEKVMFMLASSLFLLLPLLLLLPTLYESILSSRPYGVDAFQISESHRRRRHSIQLQPLLLYTQPPSLSPPPLPLLHYQQFSNSATRSFLDRSRSTTTTTTSPRITTTILFMGKGDGKKKRPKKKKSSGGGGGGGGGGADSSLSSSHSQSLPQRVTTDLNIPIRRQIMYGKLNKAMRSGTAGTSFRQPKKVRTAYRRSWNETEIETAAEARRRKGQEVDWDVVLNSTLWKNPPLVLVDGYNVINKWSRLKKHFAKGDLERSRQLLCDDLENLAELKGWRIEVVFDAARAVHTSGQAASNVLGANPKAVRSTLQQRLAPSKEVLKHGRVRTIFTGSGIEADSYIEGRCLEAKNIMKNDEGKLIQSLIVATDDNMIRVCASSCGAVLMSASRFVTELKACQHSTQYRVELAMSQVNNMPMRPEKLWNTNVFVQSNYRNNNYVNGNSNGAGKGGSSSGKTTGPNDGDVIDDELLGKVHKVETKNDGSTVYVPRFGSGSVIIEDRRNRNRNKKKKMNQVDENLQNKNYHHHHHQSENMSTTAPSSLSGDATSSTSSAKTTSSSNNTADDGSSSLSTSSSKSSMFDILGQYKNQQQQQQQQKKD